MRNKFKVLFLAALFALFSGQALAAGDLVVFTFAEYIDPEVIQDFQDEYDVKVRLDY